MDFLAKWNHLPWKHWNSPSERFKELPTFVIGEYLVYMMTLCTFFHARRQGKQHMLVWLASFITGSANDIFFMALPLVDNFWQSQATIMITPRLPLYICCVYNVFLYTSTVTVWRLGLPRLPEAALTGLVAELVYGPYDIIGNKFIWWTWHDTDPPIKARFLGAPIGSSLWILTFSATFALFIRILYLDRPKMSAPLALVLSAIITTPTMMAEMALLQAVSGDTQGAPTHRSFIVCFLAFVLTIGFHLFRRNHARLTKHPAKKFGGGPGRLADNGTLSLGLFIYFITLVLIACLAVPEKHKSTGIHQTYGPCGVEVFDFSGQVRHKYVCAEEMDEDWDFSCLPRNAPPASQPPTQWYTVCGKPHTDKKLMVMGVGAICSLGLALYSSVLGHPFRARLIAGRKLA